MHTFLPATGRRDTSMSVPRWAFSLIALTAPRKVIQTKGQRDEQVDEPAVPVDEGIEHVVVSWGGGCHRGVFFEFNRLVRPGSQRRTHSALPCSSPRAARLAMKARRPKRQGAALSLCATRLCSAPSQALWMVTTSPSLWVKPPPGWSRSSMGANKVPRNSMKPSGYWWAASV